MTVGKDVSYLLYDYIPDFYWRRNRMFAIPSRALTSDPRIDSRAPWLRISDSTAPLPRWHVKYVGYDNENESGGNHNIYITVLDENGAPLDGIPVWQKWPSASPTEARQRTLAGTTNFGIWGGPFYPDRGEAGAYWVYVGDDTAKSDVVRGMGLPVNRHVNYRITVQRLVANAPPMPGQGVTAEQVQVMINSAFARAHLALD